MPLLSSLKRIFIAVRKAVPLRTWVLQARHRYRQRRDKRFMRRYRAKAWRDLMKNSSQVERDFLKQHSFRNHHSTEKLLEEAKQKIIERYGRRVVAGPFEGLRYVDEAFCSGYTPKILGCYEAELQGEIERVLVANYELIIDIGAAEGYYAVGLAYRLPEVHVIAFEDDEHARELCKEMASINGLMQRVEVHGACTPELLQKTLEAYRGKRTLIICDVEGYEIELMNPKTVPDLMRCDFLVELHDCYNPQITSTLTDCFKSTHHIHLVDAAVRDPSKVPASNFLPPEQRRIAIDDDRGHWMQWGIFTAQA